MTTFFFSDPHFEHELMAKKRGFATVEEHDASILKAVNSTVGRKDRLVILGDFGSVARPSKFRARINCKQVHLVIGNHDKPGKVRDGVFSTVREYWKLKLSDGFKVVLFHYPILYWDGSHNGTGHLYGHMHDQREDDMNFMIPGRKSMEVSIESLGRLFGSFRPISEHEVSKLLQGKAGHDPVEYYLEKSPRPH